MHCLACRYENPAGSLFCAGCGSALSLACTRCKHRNPADARFCNKCGQALSPTPKGPGAEDGERRQLTVLFCDMVGSTELAARLDPEDWGEVAARYQRIAAEAVTRFGGHVAQYLGDGLLVYFGYPQAHDDDPERAVRGGLAILDAMQTLNDELTPGRGLRLAVRVGIHTGAVVVGTGSNAGAAVFGETPNLAARLQAAAAPDTVVMSAATLRLVRGIFVTADLGLQTMKGFAEPVAVHRVLQPSGVRSRLDLGGVRLTPLVGREPEVGFLLDRWTKARAHVGHSVLITGEPGVGKSRLVHTLRERLVDEPHTWLECRCSPYVQHSAFQPVIELVEQGLAFQADDTPADKIAKLERGLGLSGFSLPETVPLFAEFLSIPLTGAYAAPQMSPESQRQRTLDALVAWALALGELQPVLVVFEDLHWCDPSSLELLGRLIDHGATARVMMLLTARPEFSAPWPARPEFSAVEIHRLPKQQTREMIAALHPERSLPDAVMDMIAERADGIPLYVEELALTVVESGLLIERAGGYELTRPISDLAIPPTLHDSLMARLDRLSAAKEVAQRAAALGREFPYALLLAVAELDEPTLRHGLERLVQAELLFQNGTPPEAIYTFKHALIQDAAYGSLLKRTRLRLHARIAQVLVESFPARAAAAPEVVARHYEAAGLADQAATYCQRAGERAAARSAHEEAIAHLRKGIDLLALLPESHERNLREARMQVALGSSTMPVRGYAHSELQTAYERARVLCEATGDAVQLGYALLGLSIFHSNRGELEPGAVLAERVLQLAQQTGDEAHLILGHTQAAIPKLYQGKFAAALEHCERAIALYDPARHRGIAFLSGTDQGVAAVGLDAWSLWHLGYPERAAARGRQGIELARKLEHPFSLAYALFFDIGVHNWSRETEPLHAPVEEVIALGQVHGFPLWRGLGMTVRGWVRAWDRGDASAIAEMLEGIALAGSTGLQGGIPAVIGLLASAYQAVGQPTDALQTVDSAFALSAQTGQPYWDAELHRMKGELLFEEVNSPAATAATERRADAEVWLRRALEIARAQGGKSFELRAATSLAKLLRTCGQRAEARALLEPIYCWFTEGLRTPDLTEAKALLAELS